MADKATKRPLRIGYIWQYETANLGVLQATSLHIRAVIDAFKARGHHVRIITFHQRKPHWSDDLKTWHPIEPRIRPWPLRIFESVVRRIQSTLQLPYFNYFDSVRFADVCQIAGADCDVFYERFWILASGAGMAANRLGIPIVYEVNGDLVDEYEQQGTELPAAHWRAIYYVTRRMFENAGQVVTVSETLKQKTIERWRLRTSNVSAVENGAHVDLFANPNKDNVEAVRSKYRLNKSPAIIFVGTFKPWHGLDLLINAFAQVTASDPDVKLILVGDGPLKAEMETQVAKLRLEDRIIFTGLLQHQEIPALLGAANIAVLNPRLSQASAAQSPLKLFEYMAAGKAIVAPINANTQCILTDRKTGLLIPPDDQKALQNALLELLQDHQLRDSLGQAAQRQAIEKHSWNRTVSEIESMMYKLVNPL